MHYMWNSHDSDGDVIVLFAYIILIMIDHCCTSHYQLRL